MPSSTFAPTEGGLSRRGFLAGTAATAALSAGLVTMGSRYAFATPENTSQGDVVIALFLRGGADGLSLVAPYAMPSYQALRPTIRVKAPGEVAAENAALPLVAGGAVAPFALDGVLGMHPGLAALHAGPWSAGDLAVVHAAGMPAAESDTRSHFDSMKNWEVGSASINYSSGFLNRYLATIPGVERIDAVGLGGHLQRSLAGQVSAFSMYSPESFNVGGFSSNSRARTALTSFYDAGTTDLLLTTGADTMAAIGMVAAIDWSQFQPQNGAVYGDSEPAQGLRDVARLIRANIGLRAVALDFGGWDTHEGMGAPEDSNSYFRQHARDLGDALAAFHQDLGADMAEVTLFTMTEFGRTINENGSGGTDHGRGSVQFVMGANVAGGVYGDFVPSINDGPEGDLAVLNDWRRSVAEVLTVRGGAGSVATIFPTMAPSAPFGLCEP